MSNSTTLDAKVMQSNENIVARTYWKQRMEGVSPAAYLHARAIDAMFSQMPALTAHKLTLASETALALQALAPSVKAKHIVLLSALGIYLHKLSAQPELLVFTPLYSTQDPAAAIPVRMTMNQGQNFRQHLTALKENILVDFAYPDFSAEAIWELIPAASQVSHRVGMLVEEMQNRNVFQHWHPGILFIFKTNDGLALEIEYNADQFEADYIESLGALFEFFLKKLLQQQETSIGQVQLITPEDIQTSLQQLPSSLEGNQEVLASYGQERLWFLDSFEDGTDSYNIPVMLHFTGKIELPVVEKAIALVLEQYEIMGSTVVLKNEKPWLIPAQKQDFSLTVQDIAAETTLNEVINEAVAELFELDKQLFRIRLLRINPAQSTLLFVLHHLITDRYSAQVIAEQTMTTYHQLLQDDQYVPAANGLPYRAFAQWQRKEGAAALLALLTGSKQRLGKQLKPLELPLDKPRTPVHRYKGQSIHLTLPSSIFQSVQQYAQEAKLDPQVILIGGLMVLLYKYARHEEVVIGLARDNRDNPVLRQVLGPVSNVSVLQGEVKDEDSIGQFLQQVQTRYEQSLPEQWLPFEKLAHEFPQTKDMSRNALVDVLFRYETRSAALPHIEGLKTTLEEPYTGYSRYELDLLVQQHPQSFDLTLTYNEQYLNAGTVQALSQHYVQLLQNMLVAPDSRIEKVQVMSEAEKQLVLEGFNQTTTPYPTNGNIIELFEAQVAKMPHQKAVQFGDFVLSYQDLDDWSGQFASYLVHECQAQVGDLIGIMLEREEYLIPAIYGILKAGCAYVPIDPHFPVGRIQSILNDSGIQHVITRNRHVSAQITFDHWLDLDLLLPVIEQQEKCTIPFKGNDLAYVIYTSGSTGKPKGVMIEHHSVVNRLLWMQKNYSVVAEDVFLQKTPLVFDVSVWELFWWSFTGASLYVLPPGGEKDIALMLELIEKKGVSVIHFVPSMLSYFLAEVQKETSLTGFYKLRMVFASGEALQAAHVEQFDRSLWRWNQTRLINLYGPTEATVDVSHYECDFSQTIPASIPIGKPIDNIRFYITDQWGAPLPIGLAGELAIAGAGLARGYLNNEKLTQEKFVHPKSVIQERIYKTGDLAKWAPDGNVIFLGRIDNQVKLRGLRIELGEIEYALALHESVQDAAVLMKEMNGEQYLVAYYMADQVLASDTLRGVLLQRLPDYMIPSFFVHLHQFPLSTNGKLDRKALPSPELEENIPFEATVTKTEALIAEIWGDVLKQNPAQISATRSFFEVGGHSLLAMAVVNKLLKRHNVAITLKEFLNMNTIRELARHVDLQSWLNEDAQEKETSNGVTEIII